MESKYANHFFKGDYQFKDFDDLEYFFNLKL